MASVEFIEPTSRQSQSMVAMIGRDMRWLDKREVWRSSRREPVRALLHSVAVSSGWCRVVTIDGEPCAVVGLARLDDERASPWLLGTDLLTRHPRTLLRWGRWLVQEFHRHASRLEVYVDSENEPACRYLRRLGFDLQGPVEHGPNLAPFYLAVRERDDV